MGRKVYEIDLVDVKQYLKEGRVCVVMSKGRTTERVIGEILGVTVGGRVAVMIEEWFVNSDGMEDWGLARGER